MNILVYDVAASRSGALSILREYHTKFCQEKSGTNEYFFVVSTPELPDAEHVHVLRFPWIKKSWLHRLFFDYIYGPRLVRNYRIDRVFSLQNVLLPGTGVPQALYLHQPLPFVPQRFSFWKNKRLWANQHIISHMIYASVKKAEKVIVQTKWMKEACVRICGVSAGKIVLEPPQVETGKIQRYAETEESRHTFFYPATPLAYKNHQVILDACCILKKRGIEDYRVIFTLQGNENPCAAALHAFAQQHDLPIEFHGRFLREEVFALYAKSVVLFPSYIETFGMPLLEARLSGTPILAADTPFAREILEGYEKKQYFVFSQPAELADGMEKILEKGGC